MTLKKSISSIFKELKTHAPFTLAGAVLGIVFMLVFKQADQQLKSAFFKIAHPAHVVLSAIVTASMLRCHSKFRRNFFLIIIMAWVGAIGVATVSDILIPHMFGTRLFNLNIPVHSVIHEHEHDHHGHSHDHENHAHDHKNHQKTATENAQTAPKDAQKAPENAQSELKIHLAFIENWAVINSAALAGILVGFFRPTTKFPHSGHVLISTWASSGYILMTANQSIGTWVWLGILVVLFISVWLPCCISDIVFPMLFVDGEIAHPHCNHGHHS